SSSPAQCMFPARRVLRVKTSSSLEMCQEKVRAGFQAGSQRHKYHQRCTPPPPGEPSRQNWEVCARVCVLVHRCRSRVTEHRGTAGHDQGFAASFQCVSQKRGAAVGNSGAFKTEAWGKIRVDDGIGLFQLLLEATVVKLTSNPLYPAIRISRGG